MDTAIITFIGIVLFTASNSGESDPHAILPRITGVVQEGSPISGTIEEHKAYIVFRAADLVQPSNPWPAKLAHDTAWQYVELDGEQVEFLSEADSANDVPAMPTLPRVLVPPLRPVLKPEFLLQSSYSGASGMIDIPAGTLYACKNDNSRVDTRLALRTRNVLIISARKPGEARSRTITLQPGAVVYVMNVPPRFGPAGTGDETILVPVEEEGHEHTSHARAYLDMVEITSGSLDETQPELLPCRNIAPSVVPPPWLSASVIDAQCSNRKLQP